jgi:hypothetical protein
MRRSWLILALAALIGAAPLAAKTKARSRPLADSKSAVAEAKKRPRRRPTPTPTALPTPAPTPQRTDLDEDLDRLRRQLGSEAGRQRDLEGSDAFRR